MWGELQDLVKERMSRQRDWSPECRQAPFSDTGKKGPFQTSYNTRIFSQVAIYFWLCFSKFHKSWTIFPLFLYSPQWNWGLLMWAMRTCWASGTLFWYSVSSSSTDGHLQRGDPCAKCYWPNMVCDDDTLTVYKVRQVLNKQNYKRRLKPRLENGVTTLTHRWI